MQGIFERLDRKRFEVFCFSLELFDGSEPARRMVEAVTEFQFVKGLDSRLVSEMINSVQAHIMIDLNGYTDGGRSELMPLRPAPVTVAYLGYPYTMALNGVDYTVTDRVVTPPEQYTSCFAEHLAYLPHTYMVSDHRQSHAASITGTFSMEEAKKRSLRHADSEVFFFFFFFFCGGGREAIAAARRFSGGFFSLSSFSFFERCCGTRILRWSWQTSYMSFL